MQIQNINNQTSFRGRLNIISVNNILGDPLLGNTVRHNEIKTTKFQDVQIRRVTDQIVKFDPEKTEPQFLDESQTERFVKLFESITGFTINTSATQRKFVVNKPNTIIFSDEIPKNGGTAVRFDMDSD